MAAKQI